jgi:4-hydroxythreonine-4-phosphate dehydrogenase
MSLPLAVTMGDPAGICPELTVQAWKQIRQGSRENTPTFFAIDDPENLRLRSDGQIPIAVISSPSEAQDVFHNALPVLSQTIEGGAEAVRIGQPNVQTAQATISSIQRAVGCVQDGFASAVVTNPITKKVLYEGVGFTYPGHTEFLAGLCGVQTPPVMMLAGEDLRVVPTTIHIPLEQISHSLTQELIFHTIQVVNTALLQRFSIAHPRIAVSGLNPHAGEGGSIGTEEKTLIEPAIQQARALGVDVDGCFPADTLFHAAKRSAYDCAICMYHDQALIPIKMLHFDSAVNVTLGIPIIRTSPDHGTAYDIAGQGKANVQSFLNAIYLAHNMSRNRV